MITLSLPWLIALVVLLFFVALVLMACYKSPMRKWFCFGLSAVTIAYLLYIIAFQQHDPALKFDWYIVAFVGIAAALALSGVGFMDLVKRTPNTITNPELSEESALLSSEGSVVEDDEAKEDKKEEDFLASDDTAIVLAWFFGQIGKFSEEEQNAIKVCVGEFVNDGTIKAPSIQIVSNADFNQEDIYVICSCFPLIGKKRMDCAQFAKIVFGSYFLETEKTTIEKKLKGKNTMRELIGM
jgi:hypothetical protein